MEEWGHSGMWASVCCFAVIGVLITGVLVAKRIKEISCGDPDHVGIGDYLPADRALRSESGTETVYSDTGFQCRISRPKHSTGFGKLNFTAIPLADLAIIVFVLLFMDLFDTLGTLIGVSAKSEYA